jgi:hypothetical protein
MGLAQPKALANVSLTPYILPPSFVVQIPRNSLPQAGNKRFARCPTKLIFYLTDIHCVARIMTRSILNEGDQFMA